MAKMTEEEKHWLSQYEERDMVVRPRRDFTDMSEKEAWSWFETMDFVDTNYHPLILNSDFIKLWVKAYYTTGITENELSARAKTYLKDNARELCE